MKNTLLIRKLLAGILAILPLAAFAEKPNIIYIMADDLGWADIGCYGNDFIETPHLDQLAADGMRFTDFYAAGAVCSPTRCAVQSGQNQARIGITAHIPGHWRPFERVQTPLTTMALPLDTVTIAESLKEAGYTTGYIGKWHLGNAPEFQPEHQGYDWTAVVGGPFLPGKFRVQHGDKSVQPAPDQFRTDFEAQLAEDYVKKQGDDPFFLMVSPYAVHIPLASRSDLVEKYEKKAAAENRDLPHPVYAAMTEELDDLVGRIVAAVESTGKTEETMIVFSSDNGGLYRRYDYREHADDDVTSNAPLRGEKGQLYEGGIRVPLIVKYPPLVKAGTESETVSISYDFYPTFVEMAGGSLPENQTIDGLSLVPVLKDPATALKRNAVHFHYPHYHHHRPASAIREGEWKLIEYLDRTGEVELFHLASDPGEAKDLSEEKKGRVADLKGKLKRWQTRVTARMPIPNPHFNEERAGEWWSLRNGQPVDSDGRKRFPPTEKDL
ncbi:MAG: sulfatase [Verrucomicrobiales bacterium]|nr:sulfatase [Verrucomicrobiales bacterium]